jgi:methyltransferase (TIGR00027 family)
VALWRALHVQIDPPPHVLNDEMALRLIAPDASWRARPDMNPEFTRPFRASIVARARFIEDLVLDQVDCGVSQYVILGAGVDTFAQRVPEIGTRLRVFEVDRPEPQAWKRQRLIDLGFGVPEWLRFVPVDFESGHSWWDRLKASGFDPRRRAVVAAAGLSMYLSKDAITATMRQAATLAGSSTFVMTFLLPPELAEQSVRGGLEESRRGAQASGTPFISFFTPPEIVALARSAGFTDLRHVSAADLGELYFSGRTDGLRPPDGGEEIIVATT